jgi:hypothetical protein
MDMLAEMYASGLTEQAISDLTPLRRVKRRGRWVEEHSVSQAQVNRLRSGVRADPRASTYAAVNTAYLQWKADAAIAMKAKAA